MLAANHVSVHGNIQNESNQKPRAKTSKTQRQPAESRKRSGVGQGLKANTDWRPNVCRGRVLESRLVTEKGPLPRDLLVRGIVRIRQSEDLVKWWNNIEIGIEWRYCTWSKCGVCNGWVLYLKLVVFIYVVNTTILDYVIYVHTLEFSYGSA